MTETEFIDLITKKENQTLEFKESTGEKKEICETICAFANSDGGIILVGVKTNGSLSKAEITDKSQTDVTDLFVNFKPMITSLVSFEMLGYNSYNILAIRVEKSARSTNFYNGKCWKRVGASNKDITEELINQMANKNHDWSAQPCEGATIEDLDRNAFDFLKGILKVEKPSLFERVRNYSNLEFLQRFNLAMGNQISNAAVLLFGREDRYNSFKHLWHQARIQWIYDVDADITAYGRIRENFEPPLLPKVQLVWEKIDSRNDPLADQDLWRNEEKQFDEISIRELLINAIIHRDWENYGTRPFIEIYQNKDGISFKNSGEYPFKDLHELEIKKPRRYRNPVLAFFFVKIGLADQESSGIIDKVAKVQNKKGLPSPRYSKVDGETWVELKTKVEDKAFARILLNKDLDQKTVILLDRIAKGENLVGRDISKNDLASLKKQGLIKTTGRSTQRCFLTDDIAEITGKTGLNLRNQLTKDRVKGDILKHIDRFGKVQFSDLKNAYPEFTDDQLKRILTREMHQKDKTIILVRQGAWKDWYYVRNSK
jgi:ATP-dependent DNA helicase RecG